MKAYLLTGFDWILFILAYFSAVCTIVTTFVGSGNFRTILVSILGLVLLITFFWYKVQKAKNTLKLRIEEISEKLHAISHNTRNERSNIVKSYDSGSLTPKVLNDSFEHMMIATVDSISEMLTKLTQAKVCVSIKFFEKNTADISSATIRNLVSCKNTQIDRRNAHQRNRVSSITEYRDILIGGSTFFYCADLYAYDNYDYPSDWRKYYRTKMVFPIRVSNGEDEEGRPKYEVLGFICADSEKKECFKEHLEMYKNLIFGIADNMYSCFYDYIYYSQRLQVHNREGGNNETSGAV